MATNISKQGIANASMTLGANIIPNTSNVEIQYSYPSTGYSDRFYATTTIVPSASQYTLSFYAKSTVSGDIVRAHYYSPNTTTKCESSQGITKTASDGNIDFTLSTKWERYWVVYTQSSTTAVKHVIFPRMFSQERSEAAKGTGVVSVKGLKLEEGAHPTPWVANNTDTNYVSDTCGFFESPVNQAKAYIGLFEANQFYEL